MKIDLSTLDSEPVSFRLETDLTPEMLDPDLVAGEVSVELEGRVWRQGEDSVRAAGALRARGALACSRCLEPVVWSGEDAFAVELRPAVEGSIDDDFDLDDDRPDVVFVEHESLELEALAAEQVLLMLPMRILCSEDCAGLCPRCGANRNVGDACRCEPDVDPRWAALAGLEGRPS